MLLAFALASERTALPELEGHPLNAAVRRASQRWEHGAAQDYAVGVPTWRGFVKATHVLIRAPWLLTGERHLAADGDTAHDPAVAAVVAGLAEVPLVPVSAELLAEALSDSVDAAMYWQAPDPDDQLCATPEVSAALGRVAEHVAGSAAVQAWAAPLDRAGQWQVTWDSEEFRVPPDLARWRDEVRSEEQAAQRDRPADPRANFTAGWWSYPPWGLICSTGPLCGQGPAGLWLVEDSFGWRAGTAHPVAIDPAARVFEVNGAHAWAELCARFPLEVTASKRHDWFRTTRRVGTWVIPDWSEVAAHYDGVRLSVAGYLEAATTAIEVGSAVSMIAGWVPGSTWWFTDAARREGDPVRWVADDNRSWSDAGKVRDSARFAR